MKPKTMEMPQLLDYPGRKPVTVLALLLTLLGASYGKEPPAHRARTAKDAENVVRHYIRDKGGDPSREDFETTKTGELWRITVRAVSNPAATGPSRHVPVNFSVYEVNTEGKITKIIPGP